MGTSSAPLTRASLPSIRFAWLIPSYACNKSCDFCYNGEDYLADKSSASVGAASRMVSVLELFAIEHITLLGGEPLIYPQLQHLVAVARGTGAKISIVTNGTLFVTKPQKLAWMADAGFEQILVSLEPPVFDVPSVAIEDVGSLRRRLPMAPASSRSSKGPDWKATVQALDALPRLPVRYVIKLFPDTVRSVPRVVDAIANSAHRRILFSFGTSVISDPDSAPGLLSPRALVDNYVRLEQHCQRVGIAPSFYMNLPLCMFPADFLSRVVPEERATFGCSLLRGDSLVLDHHGKIAQCTHFMPLASENVFSDEGGRSAGDVLRDSWSTGEAARTHEVLSVARHRACLDCPSFHRNCWGGCPILWSQFDPADYIVGYPRC